MKKVFLVAPTHMNLYQDIVDELRRQNYEVEFLALKVFPHDPYFVFRDQDKHYDKEQFLKTLEKYWINLHKSGEYSFYCDYLIVINGSAVHPILFSLLKQHNPDVKCINYLFDSTQNTYRFDRNFPYYDKIFTFDRNDVKVFGLAFLPIFWVPIEKSVKIDVKVFGLGVFNKTRYGIFKTVKTYVDRLNKTSYIKLYVPKDKNGILLWIKSLYRTLRPAPGGVTFKELKSGLITHESMSPDLFRQYVANADVIVDTSNAAQDGLTARFMWALGAGKKIITNNFSVSEYPFYSKKQFFVLGKDADDDLEKFIAESDFAINDKTVEIINKWRIDNWVATLLKGL